MIEVRSGDENVRKLLPLTQLCTDKQYVPSQFALPFKHHEKDYIFNTLTKQCVVGVLPPFAKAGQEFDDLIDARFLIPVDSDECDLYNSVFSLLKSFYRKKDICSYTILPTTACNARCTYCFEEGREAVSMTPETVEQTVRFILNTHRNESVNLSWFGGEPLLRPDIIDRICTSLREAGVKYNSTMISNGSLITPEIVKKMKQEWLLTNIQLTMDGSEKEYISRKRYIIYLDYYHKVMQTISDMSEAGILVTVRCNVDEANWEDMFQLLEDMKTQIVNKDNVFLYFTPLFQIRASENDVTVWKRVEAVRSAAERSGFKAGNSFSPSIQNLRMNHCMADLGHVAIGPDGSLYPCEQCPTISRYGDIWQGAVDETVRTDFCRMDRTREKCRKCSFLPNCTNFACCPVYDYNCQEVQKYLTVNAVKRLIDEGEEKAEAGETSTC